MIIILSIIEVAILYLMVQRETKAFYLLQAVYLVVVFGYSVLQSQHII